MCTLWLLMGSVLVAAQADVSPATRPTETSPVNARGFEFAPGIVIDWANRAVEVDATVVLRRGPIELFACSPGIREYESIVRVEAKPTDLFHALGLIGLVPGHPIRLNERTGIVEAATGDPVRIEVRYGRQGQTVREPIERWLRPVTFEGDDRPQGELDLQSWIFAGSFFVEQGGIAADFEGTVIAVVNFGSSLVCLPELHSASYSDLWVEPASERIPAEQTRCTLIFEPGPFQIDLDASGRLALRVETVTLAGVGRSVLAFRETEPDGRVRITVHPHSPIASRSALLGLLNALGIPADSITLTEMQPTPIPAGDPDALKAWGSRQLQSDGSPIGQSLYHRRQWGQLARDLGGHCRILADRAARTGGQMLQMVRELWEPPGSSERDQSDDR